jgi:uncharacterized membrane protein YhaH (DUF805 family)
MKWMFLPLSRYAEFSGRSRRKEYWLFFLGLLLLYSSLFILMMVLLGGAVLSAIGSGAPGTVIGQGFMGIGVGMMMVLAWWAFLIPSIAVGVRRLHDIDRSGWWLMLGWGPWLAGMVLAPAAQSDRLADIFTLASAIGFVVLLALAMLPGTRGPNRFGPDPREDDLHYLA